MVGRIGGDEFLVLMKGVQARDIIDKKSAQILGAVSNITVDDVPENSLSCSVGVAFIESDNTKNYDELFCIADRAMYLAKSNGGNRVELCLV